MFSPLSIEIVGRGTYLKYLLYVFTEQGIAILFFESISNVGLKQLEYQKQADKKLEQILEYISEYKESSQKVFFDGLIYDAFSLIVNLI